ncbi:MAG: hypothetical protein HY777_14295, partial [Betaproteobacteria bacterium]|nr:hypothetical protein [Betaproteobacteria bacterium]
EKLRKGVPAFNAARAKLSAEQKKTLLKGLRALTRMEGASLVADLDTGMSLEQAEAMLLKAANALATIEDHSDMGSAGHDGRGSPGRTTQAGVGGTSRGSGVRGQGDRVGGAQAGAGGAGGDSGRGASAAELGAEKTARQDPLAGKLRAYLRLAEAHGHLAPLVGALRRAVSDHAAGLRQPSVAGALAAAEKKFGELGENVVRHAMHDDRLLNAFTDQLAEAKTPREKVSVLFDEVRDLISNYMEPGGLGVWRLTNTGDGKVGTAKYLDAMSSAKRSLREKMSAKQESAMGEMLVKAYRAFTATYGEHVADVVDGLGESGTALATTDSHIELPKTSIFTKKDQIKSDKATKFIGRGSARSSTAAYAKAWGERANSGEYSASERVFLSVEGDRSGRVGLDTAELQKAMDARSTIITDDVANRERSYNVGEREAAAYLSRHGYVETKPGEWGPLGANPPVVTPSFLSTGSKTTLATTVSEHDAGKAADAVTAFWSPDAAAVEFAPTFGGLPKEVQDSVKKEDQSGAKGVFHPGSNTIWVILDKHADRADIEETLYHEGGHWGTLTELGAGAISALDRSFGKLGVPAMSAIAREHGFAKAFARYLADYLASGKTAEDRARLVAELLAGVAQKAPYRAWPKKLRDTVLALVGALRNGLKARGYAELSRLGEADVLYLVARGNKRLVTGGRPAAGLPAFLMTLSAEIRAALDSPLRQEDAADSVRFSKGAARGTPATQAEQDAARQSIIASLGDTVETLFVSHFPNNISGTWTRGQTKNVIRLALGGDVAGAAYHEALHEFFHILRKRGGSAATALFERVAKSGIVFRAAKTACFIRGDGHDRKGANTGRAPACAKSTFPQFWQGLFFPLDVHQKKRASSGLE